MGKRLNGSRCGNYEFKTYPLNPTYGINHLCAVIESFEERLSHWNKNLSEAEIGLEAQKQIAAEPFDQAEKLKQKRIRYNEVMDILNPPKEEQNLDTDGGDAVQYQQRKNPQKDIREDIYFPKNSREASAFIRSYANKTNGMKGKSTKKLLIFTENNAYFATAAGYLKGDIERILPILGNEDIINTMRKEFNNDSYAGTKAFDTWAQDYGVQYGRDGWDRHAAGHTGVSGRNDAVDVEASGSNTFGSYWESLGYNSWEEVREAVENGALIPDENGDIIVLEQHQQRTHALTDREVLAKAASQVMLDDLTEAERDGFFEFYKRLSCTKKEMAFTIRQFSAASQIHRKGLGKLRQHRTMGQALSAWDFVSSEGVENVGILCVFSIFHTVRLEQKTR